MMYKLTLETDEYTLCGEVYEREDKKGWEYRLRYKPKFAPHIIPCHAHERVWESDGLFTKMAAEEAMHGDMWNHAETIPAFFS
jgi:hypothetical protein